MRNKAAQIFQEWQRQKAVESQSAKSALETFALLDINERHLPLFGGSRGQRELRQNTAIEACSRFIRTAVVEADVVVKRPTSDDDDIIIQNHELPALLQRPNDYYLGSAMRAMIAWDLTLTGTAYVIVTDTIGGMQLHWYPSFAVEPRYTARSNNWIDWFDVLTDNGTERIEPERVIQFRNGIDPTNMRKGYSPLKALLREVLTDNEATEYTYYVLANTGVPGMIISPTSENADSQQLIANAPEIKRKVKDTITGANRGEPVIMGYPMKIELPSFSPNQMVLDKLRDIPEERITAVLGIPAAVVGLGTGLQQTKVGATMKELRREAYEGGIIPIQKIMAETWTFKLLPRFNPATGDYVAYDNSQSKVFQEDENDKHRRVRDDWRAGLITLAQALTQIGLKPEPGDENVRIFDMTIGRLDRSAPNEEEKMAALKRIKQRQQLFDALQLGLDFAETPEERNGKPQRVAD